MAMFSNDQIKDIVETKGNVLVSSSAGTGKTTTLIHKIISLLEEKHKVLALTFSNAATQEIIDRLEREKVNYNLCTVSTFHAFCLKVINNNYQFFGAEEPFKVLSSEDASLYKLRIAEEILKNYPDAESNAFKSLLYNAEVSYIGQPKERLFTEIYDFSSSIPNSDKWLEEVAENYRNSKTPLMYDQMKIVCEIIKELDKKFSELKKSLNCIDFVDMEKFVLKFFSVPENVKTYSELYDDILVDEYQDTSVIQEKFLNTISRDNIFCVGDLKQSIYGFRNATPDILQKRYNEYSDSSSKGTLKFLNYNYRSNQNIINFINDIFLSYSDNKNFFNQEAKLICKREKYGHEEIKIIHTPEVTKDAKVDGALAIVNCIKELMTKTVFDPKINDFRPVRYSDITLITRNLVGVKGYIQKEFEEAGIPYSITQSQNLLSDNTIKSLISILKMFVYHADVDFIHFFHNNYLGLTDDDLMFLRSINPKTGIYENLMNYENEDFQKLRELLSNNKKESFFDKGIFLLKEAGFFDKIKTEGSLEINEENVNEFVFWMSLQSASHPDWELFDFTEYLDELVRKYQKVNAPEMDFADAVNISTIHAVKGMDSLIVILGYADERISFTTPPVSFDRELGIGLKYYNVEKKEKSSTDLKNKIDEVLKQKNMEEEVRILYVALTRAREQLIIIGKAPKTNSKENGFSSYVQFIETALAKNPNHQSKIKTV